MSKILFTLLVLFTGTFISKAQNHPFNMELEPFTISGLPGLHSYATTKYDGKWLIIGGRINGLHGWQPPVAFPNATQNTNIYVVDPVNQQVWSASSSALPQNISEHISSSNMSGVRIGDYYYFIGGYGYSTPVLDLISFPNITAIEVPALMNAVINQQSVLPYFRQITDPLFATCGSRAEVLDSTVMLVFGHRFDGRYNPQNMPTFTQTYTHSIKKFQIVDNGTTFSISNYTEVIDTLNFHRRDYNLVPQILLAGNFSLTAFTGVFQPAIDMPYLNSIDINSNGYSVNNNFVQQLNQYHSAVIPFYDSISATMYSFFMGGMAQFYYDNTNTLTEDSLVPFVKTVSYISRNSIQETESQFSIEMPGYLGSNMEFYTADSINTYLNGVIKLSDIDTGKVLIGYLYGGIESDYPYVFMNGGGTSWANDKIFKVYINKNGVTGVNEIESVINLFNCYPSPVSDNLTIDFDIEKNSFVTLNLYNTEGKVIQQLISEFKSSGLHKYTFPISHLSPGIYFIYLNVAGTYRYKKLVIIN